VGEIRAPTRSRLQASIPPPSRGAPTLEGWARRVDRALPLLFLILVRIDYPALRPSPEQAAFLASNQPLAFVIRAGDPTTVAPANASTAA